MKIDQAVVADISSLLKLENTCFTTDRLTRKNFTHLIHAPSACVLVARLEKVVVGSAVVLYRKNSKLARLYSLAVHPDYQKHGFALTLMTTLERASKNRGCTRMTLEVREDNARAVHFYEKGRYQRVRTIKGFYEDGATAIVMEKALTPRETEKG